MYKIIIAILTLTTFVASGEPDKELHNKCLYPTIMITNDKPKAVGTGVIVKVIKKEDHYENYAFTCAHVMIPLSNSEPKQNPVPPDVIAPVTIITKDKYEVKVRIGVYENWSTLVGYKDYRCEVLVVDRDKDIALIRFDTASENNVAVVDNKIKLYIGNDVVKVGCGLSEPFRIDYGKITSVSNSIENLIKDSYRISAMTIMGDSGGPVYHECKLIGLSQAIRYTPANSPVPVSVPVCQIAYVIPVKLFYDNEEMIEFLKD